MAKRKPEQTLEELTASNMERMQNLGGVLDPIFHIVERFDKFVGFVLGGEDSPSRRQFELEWEQRVAELLTMTEDQAKANKLSLWQPS